MQEARKGYVAHAWLAVGHLAEAEDETLKDYPEITERIRSERLEYIDSINDFENPNYLESFFNVDTLTLIEDVTDLVRSLQQEEE